MLHRLFAHTVPRAADDGAGAGAPPPGDAGSPPVAGSPHNGGGGSSGAPADWRASLPDEYRQHPVISKFETPADLAKSWSEAQKLIGADKIVLPGKDAKPEEVAAIFEKLGKPKDVKGYEIPAIDGYEYSEQDKAFQETIKGWAHKNHLTGAQLKGLASEWNGMLMAQEQARTKALDTARQTLRAEWGDEHDARMDMAGRAIREHAKDAGVAEAELATMRLADGSFLLDNPVVARIFAAVGSTTQGSGFEGGQPGDRGRDDFASPKAAKAAITRLMGEIHTAGGKHPYQDRHHPQHKQWADRMDKLHEIAGRASE